MELLLLSLFVIMLAVLAFESSELGVDSRDLSDDPHRSNYPVGIA
jgi:hypothetical protein